MDFNGIIYESDSLQHYGVLGMKWGHRKGPSARSIRKAELKSMSRKDRRRELRKENADYNQKQVRSDTLMYGKYGSKRINKRMNKGYTHAQAARREWGSQAGLGLAGAAAYADAMSGGQLHKKAINAAKSSIERRKKRRSIPKIAQNHKYDPIDSKWRYV